MLTTYYRTNYGTNYGASKERTQREENEDIGRLLYTIFHTSE
jgi:hypothetical protein